MAGEKSTPEKLLDLAETYIRTGGYSSFSFRDLARDTGIKSASVHYHFPTKGHLAAAVALRYRNRFEQALMDPDLPDFDPEAALTHYFYMFYQEMLSARQMCLCAVLSVEKTLLPEAVMMEVQAFFTLNLTWLRKTLARFYDLPEESQQVSQQAAVVLAALQGALTGAQALEDSEYFKQVAAGLYQGIFNTGLLFPEV
ncbi:TetR/AcrR family transcriptional regulator [Gynuella sp.]|uniref:TetR/AcrR family transcriptional regulator n=1 Tax=Gynuella sp. TaxID=2969146 RepID=UPI003D0A84E2